MLTDEQEQRIREAVHQAERKTSGEIVPMVVEASSTYPHLDFVGGLLGLVLGTLLAVWVFPECVHLRLLGAQALGFAVGFLLCRHFPVVKRSLLSPKIREEEVFERALRAFQELELYRTQDRTGVLILVSLLERRVQVLADTGINARVKPGAWNHVLEIVLAGIRGKDLCSGLCDAIVKCGEILAAEFPIQSGDRNELADDLRRS